MPARLIDVERLTQPLGEESPSGPDLSYDAAFLALEGATAGTAEQQYGDTVIAAEPPDWAAMAEQAAGLISMPTVPGARLPDGRTGALFWVTSFRLRLHLRSTFLSAPRYRPGHTVMCLELPYERPFERPRVS